jgi:iron(III) transport system substrate-binding protein
VGACRVVVIMLLLVGVTVGCGSSGSGGSSLSITLYTCASAEVEQALIKTFEAMHAGSKVNVFRAPTGQLNARVAADQRSGGIRADVIWACDPLTMYGYDSQNLLRAWTPPNAADIPTADRTPRFVGIDLLEMVLVVHKGAPVPSTWADLTKPAYRGKVALPSPSFAASALGALGYFASAPGYGIDYYRALKKNKAAQVNAPADVLTGVERGTYQVGVTLANAAYADQQKGSPIQVVWPKPGGIAIYAPIGLTTKSRSSPLAEEFATYAASRVGQQVMAGQNTYVTIPGLGGPPVPTGSRSLAPNWAALSAHYKSVLSDYNAIFGG